MKFIISPAKSLNFSDISPTKEISEVEFLKLSNIIIKEIKKLDVKDLEQLMNISNNLAKLNYDRFQDWNLPFEKNKVKQAVFAFDGEVYNGLDAKTLKDNQINYLQKNVRILSGLHGILKPLDLIMPYRLEMGTKIAIKKSKNLYDFWKVTVTNFLNQENSSDDIIINLASKEYFDVIDKKTIQNKIITPEFKDYKNGKLATISFFAKKARGQMVRYAIDNKIINPIELKKFNIDNYCFDENLSSEKQWIFTR
jgi:cytoplasmic iron level regulating protein YaaA (DUF328/UPF0246 family)